jgi:hypothetical protein
MPDSINGIMAAADFNDPMSEAAKHRSCCHTSTGIAVDDE